MREFRQQKGGEGPAHIYERVGTWSSPESRASLCGDGTLSMGKPFDEVQSRYPAGVCRHCASELRKKGRR